MIERRHATALEERRALFSECGQYRYLLAIRRLEVSRGIQLLPFIGLNPSTATELEDDPTIRRCVGFARAWGYAGILMANLAAYCATEPTEMLAADDPIGPENTPGFLRSLLAFDAWDRERWPLPSAVAVACWGIRGAHSRLRAQNAAVRRELGPWLHALGLTRNGEPVHPLYQRTDTRLLRLELELETWQ